jgi:hypothetical protein
MEWTQRALEDGEFVTVPLLCGCQPLAEIPWLSLRETFPDAVSR